jgi:membrane protease YdiL (CAAX protease family)
MSSYLPLKAKRKLLPVLTLGVLIGLAIYGINYLFSSLGWWAESPFWAALIRCRVCTWAYVIDVVAVAPVVEEVFFRGLLFRAVEDGVGRRWAVVFSSLGFLLFHLVQSQWRVADIIFYLFFATSVGWLRAWSGSLWPGWVAHVIYNLIIGIGLLRA